jgi:hypothetical protein
VLKSCVDFADTPPLLNNNRSKQQNQSLSILFFIVSRIVVDKIVENERLAAWRVAFPVVAAPKSLDSTLLCHAPRKALAVETPNHCHLYLIYNIIDSFRIDRFDKTSSVFGKLADCVASSNNPKITNVARNAAPLYNLANEARNQTFRHVYVNNHHPILIRW